MADAPKPTITYSQAMAAVRKLFGPRGRIWRTPGGYALGIDKRPGRQVIVTGPDLWMLLFGRYQPPPPATTAKNPPVADAPLLTTGADSGNQDALAGDPRPESEKEPIA